MLETFPDLSPLPPIMASGGAHYDYVYLSES